MRGSGDRRAITARIGELLESLGIFEPAGDWRQRRAVRVFCLSAVIAVGGCASGGGVLSTATPMFPESKWGVSASPRVADATRPIPKGGGIYKTGNPYQVGGKWYVPRHQPDYDRTGVASWYGADFHGRRTANGEIYDMNALTAAHPTLPMPSYAYVTNPSNGRTILVRVNDRGPYVDGRIIDLSRASARALALEQSGTGRVRVRYAGHAPLNGDDTRERQFLASRPWMARVRIADAGSYHEAATVREAEASDAREREIVLGRRSRVADAAASTASPRERPRQDGTWSPANYRAGLTSR